MQTGANRIRLVVLIVSHQFCAKRKSVTCLIRLSEDLHTWR